MCLEALGKEKHPVSLLFACDNPAGNFGFYALTQESCFQLDLDWAKMQEEGIFSLLDCKDPLHESSVIKNQHPSWPAEARLRELLGTEEGLSDFGWKTFPTLWKRHAARLHGVADDDKINKHNSKSACEQLFSIAMRYSMKNLKNVGFSNEGEATVDFSFGLSIKFLGEIGRERWRQALACLIGKT